MVTSALQGLHMQSLAKRSVTKPSKEAFFRARAPLKLNKNPDLVFGSEEVKKVKDE